MKNPGQLDWTGVDGGRNAHAVGLRKGESNRLTVR